MTSGAWDVPSSWSWTTMGEVADVVGGGTPRTNDSTNYDGGNIPWITPADLSGFREKHIERGERNITQKGLQSSSARLMPKGTVLFSSRAPIGYVAISANPVATNQGFKSFVLKSGVQPEYVYYYLQRAKDLAVALSSGTTFQEISGKNAAKIPFALAPGNEQRRIVAAIESYLPRLDDAVASLKRVRANLKRYRASVLKAAVEGRLVPTEAELARKEGRDYEPAPVLLERILIERRRFWEESELARLKSKGKPPTDDRSRRKYKEPARPDTAGLPDLLEGWCWATVESLSTKVVDGVHKKPHYVGDGIPFVTVRNLTAGPGLSFENLRFITEADHAKFCERADPSRNDILVTKDGTLGVIRAVRTDVRFSIFVSVALIKPVEHALTNYLELALSSPTVQRQMLPKGSGLQHIHLEDLRQDCVPLAPLSEQIRIVEAARAHLSIIEKVEQEVAINVSKTNNLRQAILRWAFEGKLVDQDLNDEPASILLERIKADRGMEKPTRKPKKDRKANAA